MIASYFIIIPLLSGFILAMSGKRDRFVELVALISTSLLLFLSVLLFPVINAYGPVFYQLSGWKIPYTISLVIDNLSAFVLFVISLIAFFSTLYSIGYMRRFQALNNYYALLMLMIAGLNGVTITGDLFNLFVFMEVSLIATYALVAFQGEPEHYEAAFKYAILGSISSTLILFGIGCVYSMVSSLTLMQISLKTNGMPSLYLAYGLFLTGFGLKASMFPFHSWLPDAHPSAPSPVSAMLSGVLIKVLGVYSIIRVFFMVFQESKVVLDVLLVFGTITMVIGAIMAVGQRDIKRMLGFSSVSQMGYILFSLGLGTPLGILGAVYHMLNHAILKGTLFLDAGAIETAEGTRDFENMAGRSGKTVYVSTLMASLGISGVPPFGGFFSKLIIIMAAIYARKYSYALIALTVSVITMAYYLKMLKKTFPTMNARAKIPVSMKITLIILSILTIATAVLFIPAVRDITLNKVVECITDRAVYGSLFKAGGNP
ncbi:complex I subunit 5 family protein [Kosmotoga pacifica]|uniref:NADH/ubiquinone/plastoquinone (Complex I) n=1 Tax=Kosmotoga pacifica TaxID=1330330 RepID=A0A0G2Z7K1_9BACT|nr:proton-conducting transporter membrane subunit [Kosmotoga pacifica]AKI97575.1 NADH/ubiquinone/plastoquinone (complex I) [Kosmotoga pacifica]